MVEPRQAVLVSGDLIFQSRLREALRPSGIGLTVTAGEVRGGADLVFIDLNSLSQQRLEVIRAVRRAWPGATIVGFCHHGEKRLRREAMAAGADQVVTNGALPAIALRLTAAPAAPAGDG